MPQPADPQATESVTVAPSAVGEINPETQSLPVQANEINELLPRKEHVDKMPEDVSADQPEQLSNGPVQGAEQDPQTEAKEDHHDGNVQSSTEQPTGDVTNNVRISDDVALSKSEREDPTREDGKPAKRNSTFSSVVDKTKSKFIPRGRVSKRSTASHHGHNGGCTIF